MPLGHDQALYRLRYKVESMFSGLKDWQIRTRYDRYAHTYMSAIRIAAIAVFQLRSINAGA